MLTDSVALLFRAEIAGVDVPIDKWISLSAYALTKFNKPGLGFADMHAAIAHIKAGNLDALDNIIKNAKGPVANLTKKVSHAYRYMQSKEWSKASDLFLEIMPRSCNVWGLKCSARSYRLFVGFMPNSPRAKERGPNSAVNN